MLRLCIALPKPDPWMWTYNVVTLNILSKSSSILKNTVQGITIFLKCYYFYLILYSHITCVRDRVELNLLWIFVKSEDCSNIHSLYVVNFLFNILSLIEPLTVNKATHSFKLRTCVASYSSSTIYRDSFTKVLWQSIKYSFNHPPKLVDTKV